jgi:hypothetical protein
MPVYEGSLKKKISELIFLFLPALAKSFPSLYVLLLATFCVFASA